MNEAIKLAIEKGVKLGLWVTKKVQFLGIKGNVLHRLENAMLVIYLTNESFITGSSAITLATGTSTNLKNSDVFLTIQKLKAISDDPNQNGLAKHLGITREGVQRLIWSLEGALNISNGSELSSLEMTSLVRNAVLKERILKQTTTLLNTQLSLTKKELKPTSRLWIVPAYGIQKMEGHYVGNVTA